MMRARLLVAATAATLLAAGVVVLAVDDGTRPVPESRIVRVVPRPMDEHPPRQADHDDGHPAMPIPLAADPEGYLLGDP